jgi:alcohol dehydrogenase class IV
MDILCHALESYTARPYASYEHKTADQRVPYCGANPIADLWAERALSLMSTSFRAVVLDGSDVSARTRVAMAATFAGLGFGNAGVHIPHANAYPIAGQVRDFLPKDYDADHAMVPHGMAVALTAPASFGFTFEAAPERHVRAAELLSLGATDDWAERPDDPADYLPQVLTGIMREVGIPSGLAEVGYGAGDIDALVEGTMKQQRLLATAPREVTEDDVAGILDESIELW